MKWGYVIYHFWHRYINYRILCNEKAEKKAAKKPSRTAATLIQALLSFLVIAVPA